MQIDRLFQIIYLLLGKEKLTARELAQRFEVSERTIYRDIDTLSGAGIPIYTTKGKGGGIRLLPDFILNKSVLSEQEQNEILYGLQSMTATNAAEAGDVLAKLSSLFHKEDEIWIDVDFTNWGGGEEEREKFQMIKRAILERRVIGFTYSNSSGQVTRRKVEPVMLRFKNHSWYLHAFCLEKQEFRIFKICRLNRLELLEERFKKREGTMPDMEMDMIGPQQYVNLVLYFKPQMAYRVYDNFSPSQIERSEDGGFCVRLSFPEDDWVYSFLLSFGAGVQVLSPAHVRTALKEKAEEIKNLYSES